MSANSTRTQLVEQNPTSSKEIKPYLRWGYRPTLEKYNFGGSAFCLLYFNIMFAKTMVVTGCYSLVIYKCPVTCPIMSSALRVPMFETGDRVETKPVALPFRAL